MEFDLPTVPSADDSLPGNLELGSFSISLSVADLEKSKAFYEALGFVVAGGSLDQNYLILKNGESTVGIFYGMFEDNILTFNPGLTNRMERIEEFLDIREIERRLKEAGLELVTGVDPENHSGAASITLVDPDGNPILIDQFF